MLKIVWSAYAGGLMKLKIAWRAKLESSWGISLEISLRHYSNLEV
jgi:hypothetical protein